MKIRSMICYTVLIFFFLLVFSKISSAWFSDPKINTPIQPVTVSQIDHSALSDGTGGAIITWAENVGGNPQEFDIYAQKIDSQGNRVWPFPIEICTAPSFQGIPKITRDGVGGAIIVWHDTRSGFGQGGQEGDEFDNFDIYAQRINGDGQILWAENGVPVSESAKWQVYPVIDTDGLGGAIIAWDDGRSFNSQVYVQRVDQNGNILWGQDGLLIAVIPPEDGQSDPRIVADGFGGAIVAWTDLRSGINTDAYGQRVDGNGNRLWGIGGVPLASVVGDQLLVRVASDGVGGGIFSWTDSRDGSEEFDIYAQRVDAGGTIAWSPEGIPVCNITGSQIKNEIISDGLGGALVTWEDGRRSDSVNNITHTDLYVQKVNSQGLTVWDAGGVVVAATDEAQIRPSILSDGSGGAFISWQDFFRGGTWWNIYAQHIDESGQAKWKNDGIPVSIADEIQTDPLIISDGTGGVIILWYDNRAGTYFNIFAQQVDSRGLLDGGKYNFFTADKDGNPKTAFAPGELILFKSSWTVPAPLISGTYLGLSGTVINSGAKFQGDTTTYEVSP
ncbi:hypothetical protein SCALIN_C01_0132 [Candidatus Scalindua japonica]|uniref:Uncharacterized protein n=1 Tax=Candidatus Scalindua japonica TaxID=1284222 RepID=A0A286TTL0_9BACT|nr:hypothetical protein [Candidatus Scalindua japonica]GAX59201.1 hypothetical protein SCALIN_C01_0132 [Candidatus Scalindua japonica]